MDTCQYRSLDLCIDYCNVIDFCCTYTSQPSFIVLYNIMTCRRIWVILSCILINCYRYDYLNIIVIITTRNVYCCYHINLVEMNNYFMTKKLEDIAFKLRKPYIKKYDDRNYSMASSYDLWVIAILFLIDNIPVHLHWCIYTNTNIKYDLSKYKLLYCSE